MEMVHNMGVNLVPCEKLNPKKKKAYQSEKKERKESFGT